jgi:hypothetical protein
MLSIGRALPMFALVAFACGGAGGSDASADADAADAMLVDAIADVPDAAPEATQAKRRLEFAAPTDDAGHATAGAQSFNVVLSYSQPRDLRVRALDDDVPTPGVPITFTIEGDIKDGISLAPATVETGADGIATAQVQMTMQAFFFFHVRVCIDGDPGTPCLVFDVLGGEDPCCALIVSFEDYDGLYKSVLTNSEVRLFQQKGDGKPACDDLHLDALPAAAVVSPVLASLTQTAVFPVLPNLQKDGVQHYAILGLAKDDAGTVKAWGCAEATVTWGANTAAWITLVDIPPRPVGSYALATTLDLATGLDASIANVLYSVFDVLSDPGPGVLALFCTADPGNAALADFCGYLFADPAHPSVADLTEAGAAVRAILPPDAAPTVFMDPGVSPDLLSNVRVQSKLNLACGPDDAGVYAPGCVVHTWLALGLHWTIGTGCSASDPACGWSVFPLAEVLGLAGPPQTVPDASVADLALSLGPHAPPLAYGAIVRFAIERVCLPNVYGDGTDGLPAVDSFEDFLGAVLAGRACLADDTCCAVFADAVAAGTTVIPREVALSACNALRTTGPAYLRSQLASLEPAGASLHVATKAPCPLFDTNLDMKVEAIGDPAAPCAWDASWSVGGATFAPIATFYGVAE